MTPKRLFEHFSTNFPWFLKRMMKYKGNRDDGGIDIYLDTGEVLNYQVTKEGWVLKRSNK